MADPTNGDDILVGTAGPDIIDGLGGDDRISGEEGNDQLIGGSGNDFLDGGAGNDDLQGGIGNDRLFIDGAGTDAAAGGSGFDMLEIDWRDSAHALRNNGAVAANPAGGFDGAFTNFVDRTVNFTGIERFSIMSGSGADDFTTGGGNDNVASGLGDDHVNVGRGKDVANGGGGTDGLSADWSQQAEGVVVDLRNDLNSGGYGSFRSFEYFGVVIGSAHDDLLTGSAVARNETFNLGGGNDTARVFHGHDAAHGGAGTDTLAIDYSASAHALQSEIAPAAGADGFAGKYSNFVDRSVSFTGIDRFDIVTGSGADNFSTAGGDDVVSTGAGHDHVNVGGGVDTADGGDGVDGLSADFSADAARVVIDLRNETSEGVFGSFSRFEYFGTVIGSRFGDSLIGTGSASNDSFLLGAGNDLAGIFHGHDTIVGGAGRDTLMIDYSASAHAFRDELALTGNAVSGHSGKFSNFVDRTATFSGIERFVITTGSGADVFRTGTGNDVIASGAGDDLVNVGSGKDIANGGADVDGLSADWSGQTQGVVIELRFAVNSGLYGTFTSFEHFGTIVGSSHADTLIGTTATRADIFNLGGGDDIAGVLHGHDQVHGEGGLDTLSIDYRSSGHSLRNEVANTATEGGGFSGRFTNFTDRSVSFTGIERFEIKSGDGADMFATAAGDDVVASGAGDDLIDVGSGFDTADGGAATDGLSADWSGQAAGVVIDLRDHENSGGYGLFRSFEHFGTVTGSAHGDRLIGTNVARSDIFHLAAGADYAGVFHGFDTVNGGTGSDTLMVDYRGSGHALRDEVAKSEGADGQSGKFTNFVDRSVAFTGIEHFEIYAGSGADNFSTGSGNDIVFTGIGDDHVDVATGVDQANGGVGTDGLSADFSGDGQGVAINLTRVVNSGAYGTFTSFEYFQAAVGSGFADRFEGTDFARNETISLGAGNDIATVRHGLDTVHGGSGFDTLVIDYGSSAHKLQIEVDYSSHPGGGVDGKFSNFVDRSITFTSIERFVFTLGSGHDNVQGGNATDTLNGGAGNDILNGGNGNDVLTGGMGTDSLTGGGGADIFVYAEQAESGPGAARDKISDFVQGADRIDLSDMDANSTTPATEDFTFIGTAAFGSVAGQLRYTASGGITVIEGDTDGNGLADFQIELTGEIPLQSTDFIF